MQRKIFLLLIVMTTLVFLGCPNPSDGKSDDELKIGDSYQGGRIAYILKSGDAGYDKDTQHGLIVATVDQSEGIVWATLLYQDVPVITGSDYGTGLANTNAIVAQQGTGTSYAAGLCDAYTNVETGTGVYSDWYLPSLGELYKLYDKHDEIGGFLNAGSYWSSSQADDSVEAFTLTIWTCGKASSRKADPYYVRAVRSF